MQQQSAGQVGGDIEFYHGVFLHENEKKAIFSSSRFKFFFGLKWESLKEHVFLL